MKAHNSLLKQGVILGLLLICFVSLAVKPTYAQQTSFSHMCYQTSLTTPTVDGQWESTWNSGLQTTFGTNARFTDEWYLAASSPSSVVYYYLLIETLDGTNSTSDFIQISLDGGLTASASPSTTDYAINFTDNTVCTWYQGNGTDWIQIATPSSSVFQWKQSFSSSSTYSAPHLIFEMSLLKTSTELGGTQIIGPEFGMLIKTYDSNVTTYGVQSWPTVPPASSDVPSSYGKITYTLGSAPIISSDPTPTGAATSTPVHTPTKTPSPTSTATLTPSSTPTSTPDPTESPSSSPTPVSESASSFNLWDILFVFSIMSAESVVVATNRIVRKKAIGKIK